MLNDLFQDIRVVLRNLRRKPGFGLAAILILALGIGAVTVIFSALDGVVLRPLPYQDPDRLVWIWAMTNEGRENSMSAMDYFDYCEQSSSFSSIAAHLVWNTGRVITGRAEPERVSSASISANLFQTLGVEPALGRSFTAEEEVLDGPEAVVVSHGYWLRRLSGDPEVLGGTLTVDGRARQVVGVMPADFSYPKDVELWFPMRRGGNAESGRGNNNFFALGRLKEGVSLDQAEADIVRVAANIAVNNPDTKKGWSAHLIPLHERFFGDIQPLMVTLMGAISMVLLVACANLSSLFLAKVLGRQNELAVRLSLGASRWTIARHLLLESSVLALVGATAGIGLAHLGLDLVKAIGPASLPRLQSISIDSRALMVTVFASLVTGLLCGLAPALQGSRVSLVTALRQGGHATEGQGGLRLRSLLVTAQVALSLVLLIGAGLLIKSSLALQRVDPGFDAEGLLTISVQIPAESYASPEERESFLDRELAKIRGLPGIAAVAAADGLPLYGGPYNIVKNSERPLDDQANRAPALRRMVSDGYFSTLGIPLLAGRGFEAGERVDTPPVTVVSKALAEALFGDENPVGKRLFLGWGDGLHMEIVGVAADVRDYGLETDFRPTFYLPFRQYPQFGMRLAIRTSAGEPAAAVPQIREAIRSLEKDAPLYRIGTMQERISELTADAGFITVLLGCFAAMALLLAASGLYGVISFFVAERGQEIGLRVALGAGPGRVVIWVLRRGVLMAASGLAVGLVGASLGSHLIDSLLFATAPTDSLTFVAVSVFLVLVTLLACLLPARRAARIDPSTALKNE